MGYGIRVYLTRSGKNPYRLWLDNLDQVTRARIQARVLRFEYGNLGDVTPVGCGVLEARLMFGSGYRIYFAIFNRKIVVLLCGGAKSSQKQDIKVAKQYWIDFLSRE